MARDGVTIIIIGAGMPSRALSELSRVGPPVVIESELVEYKKPTTMPDLNFFLKDELRTHPTSPKKSRNRR